MMNFQLKLKNIFSIKACLKSMVLFSFISSSFANNQLILKRSITRGDNFAQKCSIFSDKVKIETTFNNVNFQETKIIEMDASIYNLINEIKDAELTKHNGYEANETEEVIAYTLEQTPVLVFKLDGPNSQLSVNNKAHELHLFTLINRLCQNSWN